MSAIKPALETLRELDNKMFLDKLAVAIHDATAAVTALGKPATVEVSIKVSTLTKQGFVEPVITMSSKVKAVLPEPDPHLALFFVDEDGNPTTNQQRQRGLDLSIAATGEAKQGANHEPEIPQEASSDRSLPDDRRAPRQQRRLARVDAPRMAA